MNFNPQELIVTGQTDFYFTFPETLESYSLRDSILLLIFTVLSIKKDYFNKNLNDFLIRFTDTCYTLAEKDINAKLCYVRAFSSLVVETVYVSGIRYSKYNSYIFNVLEELTREELEFILYSLDQITKDNLMNSKFFWLMINA